jgi:hypothetical protein
MRHGKTETHSKEELELQSLQKARVNSPNPKLILIRGLGRNSNSTYVKEEACWTCFNIY